MFRNNTVYCIYNDKLQNKFILFLIAQSNAKGTIDRIIMKFMWGCTTHKSILRSMTVG